MGNHCSSMLDATCPLATKKIKVDPNLRFMSHFPYHT